MGWFDRLFYAFVIVGAVLLAVFGFCLADWLFAIATVAVALLWAWILYCRSRNADTSRRWGD